MSELLDSIYNQAKQATEELCEKAKLKEGNIVIIGCSSSEVTGELIGTHSSLETAQAVFKGIYEVLAAKNIYLAAQCCEHLNRAIITEREAAEKLREPEVNVVPQPKAGGSFATITYNTLENPVAVEHIKADAGIDIGGVLIGMHLKEVAVPLVISVKNIGKAHITSARTRPKFIGGERAHYNDDMK